MVNCSPVSGVGAAPGACGTPDLGCADWAGSLGAVMGSSSRSGNEQGPAGPRYGGDAARLRPRTQRAGADSFGRQHAEQVEVGRFLIPEGADFVSRTSERVKDLETLARADQAHGAIHIVVDG